MQRICAIFTHYGSGERTLTGLRRLAAQTRRPDFILVINNNSADDSAVPEARQYAETALPPGTLHILQMPANLGNAGGCAYGMDFAFKELGADAVWMLDDDSWPRPRTLEKLLAPDVEENVVRACLVVDPAKGDELSWPLTIESGVPERPWKNIITSADLPEIDEIPCRGCWLGALYTREVWLRAGVPTPELFIRGEDEEYPWKVRCAGFHFVTIRSSELEHPSSRIPLIHYIHGSHSFFYEPALHVSRQYYKTRNWAWLQRLKAPRRYVHRFVSCMFYALLSVQAMLQTRELSCRRLYTLFRALHNGFYGKLAPY
ncbi:MAG: glycosyltransferase family 2 protein [Akkermansia sp.]|nr:glycosyltransferase family 2 protein [Akkermansia sp.]